MKLLPPLDDHVSSPVTSSLSASFEYGEPFSNTKQKHTNCKRKCYWYQELIILMPCWIFFITIKKKVVQEFFFLNIPCIVNRYDRSDEKDYRKVKSKKKLKLIETSFFQQKTTSPSNCSRQMLQKNIKHTFPGGFSHRNIKTNMWHEDISTQFWKERKTKKSTLPSNSGFKGVPHGKRRFYPPSLLKGKEKERYLVHLR